MFGIKHKNTIIENLKQDLEHERYLVKELKARRDQLLNELNEYQEASVTSDPGECTCTATLNDIEVVLGLVDDRFKELYTHLGVTRVPETTVPAHLEAKPKTTRRR